MVSREIVTALDTGSISLGFLTWWRYVHCQPWDHWVGTVPTTSTLGSSWPMLPPSNLQHAAHKPHSSAQPPERARTVHATSRAQEDSLLKLCSFLCFDFLLPLNQADFSERNHASACF